MKKKAPHTPQKQFRGGYVPQEQVQDHSMDIREAASPSKMRKRDSLGLGTQSQARPGLSGMQDRTNVKGAKKNNSLKARG